MRQLPLPQEGIDFYSNDYLGLARSTDLKKVIDEECKVHTSNGATGSRLLSGNRKYFEEVEKSIADFHQAESALIYSSGYTANLGLVSCLATRETTLIMDELLHASLIDGARLGRSERLRFKHNDVNDLRVQLQKAKGQKLVIVESVYSMDGDVCPLIEVADLCLKNEALLVVDEAHSIGIFGDNGSGLVQHLDLEDKVLARIMTYGKAPGIHGAAVVCPTWLREYQINFSRSLIFSTAPTPHQFSSIAGMYRYLPYVEQRREQLSGVVEYFIKRRNDHRGNWLPSKTHIQSLIISGNAAVIEVADRLGAKGINALPIRRPSVPEGKERIRFCLHSFNTINEIDSLFEIV